MADFISELPDALLLNIFSFLDETSLIQSSILSQRWRYLYTFVPIPDHIKQTRYQFKTKKTQIRKENLRLEKIAENSVSKLSIDVAKLTRLYFLHTLLIIMLELHMFGVVHFCVTLVNMLHIYFQCWNCWSRLKCFEEASLKNLQECDSRLTLAANCDENCTSMKMELLFCDDFRPRYADMAELYGLFGILLVMVISWIVAVLRWKVEIIVRIDGLKRIGFGYLGFSLFLIHVCYLLYSWSLTFSCEFLCNRFSSPFH